MVYNPKFPIDTIFNAVKDFSDYAELAQQPITTHQTFSYQGRGARGYGNRGRGNQYRQRNTAIYCWTHGACGHLGATCNTKLPGHQDAATFLDKMGGNTNN
jgi:hypothetical protein